MLKFLLTGSECQYCLWAYFQTSKTLGQLHDDLSQAAMAEISAAYQAASRYFPPPYESNDSATYEISLSREHARGFLTPLKTGINMAHSTRERNIYRRLLKRLTPLFRNELH